MTKPAPPSSGAAALAAKLKAITEAAPGLWRAGVTRVTLEGDSFELQQPPPPPSDPEPAEPDPFTPRGYAGKRTVSP